MGSLNATGTMSLKNACTLAAIILAGAACLLGQSPARDVGRQKSVANAEIARGKEAYEAECAICHYSGSALKKIGPGLKGLTARGKFADGTKVDDDGLRRWIEKGGKDMPGFRKTLSPERVHDLIAYLKTL